jgi:hypothetical protein
MNLEIENPFGVTKATEFSDEQIYQYWVDLFEERSSTFKLLNPREIMPKFILGSKGCGKTHLLRYYSYPIQKIRNANNVDTLLKKEQYIGVYAVFGGINSSRFFGKGIKEDQWEKIFEYYLEVYLASKLLTIISEVLNELRLSEYKLKHFYNWLLKLLCTDYDRKFDSIADVLEYLSGIRKKIDFTVNNAALTRNIDVSGIRIQFNPGDLIFGIPEMIIQEVSEFKKVKFIYILDELEKFSESQKQYINTLVWDKKYPCTFWIGARNYGYTTKKTRSNEELREGSEYETLRLDEVTRKDEAQYGRFAKQLCFKRVADYLHKNKKDISEKDISKSLKAFFQEGDETDIIKMVSLRYTDKEYPHIQSLRQKLNESLKKRSAKAVKMPQDIDYIVTALSYKENPILEKCKTFYFYQLWENGENLTSAAELVNKEFKNFLSNKKSKFYNIQEKYKKDLIAQLLYETDNRSIFYSGIDDIVDISWGNPRSFLVILKKIHQCAIFNGEEPFIKGHISLDSQNIGILEASKWFYEDAEVIGEDNKYLYKCISLLGEYLRGIRFSDKPSETSPSSFNLKHSDLSEIAGRYLNLMVDHSFVIKIKNGRKDKNSDRIDILYQVNRMLAPLYSLPIARRGTVNFTKEIVEVIFNPERHADFNRVYKEAIGKMTAPDFGRKKFTNNLGNELF